MNIFKLFKKPKGVVPIPTYPSIKLEDIPDASAIVFYGSPGNRITELFGSRLYGFKYIPVPFHASLYITRGETLNVGMYKGLKTLSDELLNTRRADIIVYKMEKEQREAVVNFAFSDSTKVRVINLPDYAVTDFLRFGFKWFRPSKKDFCSENVYECMMVGGVKISDHEPFNTAPWDLIEWAENNPDLAKIYTLYEGEVFKQKLGRQ